MGRRTCRGFVARRNVCRFFGARQRGPSACPGAHRPEDAECGCRTLSSWTVGRLRAADSAAGRAADVAAIMAHVERTRAGGHGATVLVEGEAGIGKSTLLSTVTAAATA